MAPLGADPQAQPVPSGLPQAVAQGPHGAQVPYSGMQQQFSPPAMNPAMPKTSTEGPPGAPTGDVIQVLRLQQHGEDSSLSVSRRNSSLFFSCNLVIFTKSQMCLSTFISAFHLISMNCLSLCRPFPLRRSQRSPSRTSTSS